VDGYLKASIAEMEIDALRERSNMGVEARLGKGKLWWGHLMYGYARNGDQVIVDGDKAAWVKQIFKWYVPGVGVREISRKLIYGGAPPALYRGIVHVEAAGAPNSRVMLSSHELDTM